jgi:very-short-patch-repair endonuclease
VGVRYAGCVSTPKIAESILLLEEGENAEEVMGAWLHVAGFPFVGQYKFHPTRRWTFDYAWPEQRIAIEVEGGHFRGGHKRGRAADTDTEKFNEATLAGWRVLRFTTSQVLEGRAWSVLHRALWADGGLPSPAPHSESQPYARSHDPALRVAPSVLNERDVPTNAARRAPSKRPERGK